MTLELNPSQVLSFRRPLTVLVEVQLSLYNSSDSQRIAFKIKTTTPKQYVVRPNAGHISPGEHVSVQITLQPLAKEPPLSEKCRDKFLVLSAPLKPDQEDSPVAEYWSHMEKNCRDSITEYKLRCVYIDQENGKEETSTIDPNISADPKMMVSTSTTPYNYQYRSVLHTKDEIPTHLKSQQNSMSISERESLEREVEQLKVQVKTLKHQVEVYKTELDKPNTSSHGRSRNGSSSGKKCFKSNESVPRNNTITPQTVGIIAFVAFLIGYLFF